MGQILRGKVALVTGASKGIGQGLAIGLSKSGAKVIVNYKTDSDGAEDTCTTIREAGGEAESYQADIGSKAEFEDMINDVCSRFGNLDVLINNAAAEQLTVIDGKVLDFEDFPLNLWQANLDVNLTGAFLCSQAVGKQMVKQGGGVILNIGSIYGVVACDQRIYGDSRINSSIAYATTKSGLINFTRYLASYWQGKNIRVNCLSPGGVFANQTDEFLGNYTSRTMLKRMASPDDLGSALLYLVSDSSSWVTGTNMIVDGGWSAW